MFILNINLGGRQSFFYKKFCVQLQKFILNFAWEF